MTVKGNVAAGCDTSELSPLICSCLSIDASPLLSALEDCADDSKTPSLFQVTKGLLKVAKFNP